MKKNRKRLISFLLTIIMCMSLVVNFGQTVQASEVNDSPIQKLNRMKELFEIKKELGLGEENKFDNTYGDPNETVRVIVELKGLPVSEMQNQKFSEMQSQKYMVYNQAEVDNVIKSQEFVKSRVKRIAGTEIRNSYGYLLNGFSTEVKRSDIDKIRELSGVINVTEVHTYYPDMNYAAQLTQAKAVWNDLGYKGEGTVVSVIDSGIDMNHKDLRLSDESKAKLKEPYFDHCTIKVPYAYNYADRNYDVYDTHPNSSMHGMHVAGIIGANGTDEEVMENKAIRGIAPESQLFAMKVFSNNPYGGGGSSDDIVAAIEDSVKYGADVINMSLGSPAGMVDTDNITSKAIKNAVESGVVVVVSAGNSFYNTYPNKYKGIADTGLVGAPGVTKETLQVASIENSHLVYNVFEYTAGNESGKIPMGMNEVDPSSVLNNSSGYEVVDLGVIDNDKPNDELYEKAKGKIALIKKVGSQDDTEQPSTFGEKKLLAQNAGAVGIIFYGDYDFVFATSKRSEITIPVMTIKKSDGEKIKSLISSGLKVNFPEEVEAFPNEEANRMSGFSSWGPAPDLDFKPEITAPGGQINSLANDNEYQYLSGTSMAAPHAAGAEALLLQAKKANGITFEGKELIDYLKNVSMNSAKIVMDMDRPSIPVSPRKQGAGLMQIKDAIKNNVTITYEGKAAAAIKEIGNTKTFELKVHNYGNEEASYTLEKMPVLTEEKPDVDGEVVLTPHDVVIDGAEINFDKSTITVAPGEEKTVKVTLTIPDNFEEDQFVEGYIKFNSADTDKTPSLSIAYMGFYGNWSRPVIVDRPKWEDPVYKGSSLVFPFMAWVFTMGQYLDADGNIRYNPDAIAINPDAYVGITKLYPRLSFARNASKIISEVVDEDGKVVKTLCIDNWVRKSVATETEGLGEFLYPKAVWNGKAYDEAKGRDVTVPDGQYYIRIKSYGNFENAQEQRIMMPMKIDTIDPAFELITTSSAIQFSGNFKLEWTASDDGSGLSMDPYSGKFTGFPSIYLNNEHIERPVVNVEGNGRFSTILTLEEGENKIDITISDNAVNSKSATINVTVDSGQPILPKPVVNQINIEDGGLYKPGWSGKFEVLAYVRDDVDEVTINGEVATFWDSWKGKAYYLEIPSGDNENKDITFIAKDKDGNELYNHTYNVTFDGIKPEIILTAPEILPTDEDYVDGKIKTDSMSLKLEGRVIDENIDRLIVNYEEVIVNPDGSFSTTVTVMGPDYVGLMPVDKAGNYTTKFYRVIANIKDQELMWGLTNIQHTQIISSYSVKRENGKMYYLAKGILSKDAKVVRLQGKVVPVKDLMFEGWVEIEEGRTKVPIYVEDLDGKVVANCSYDVYFDDKAPEINLISPCKIRPTDGVWGTKYSAVLDEDGTITLKGYIDENTAGYTFSVNGDQVINVEPSTLTMAKPGELRREINMKIPAKVRDRIKLQATDFFNNSITRYIDVVEDNKDVMTITNKTGVDKFVLGNDAKVTISVKNNGVVEQKATLIVALFDENNKMINYAYSSQEIEGGKEIDLTAGFKLPESGEGYKVKAFVWDNFENLEPLSEVIVIPVINN